MTDIPNVNPLNPDQSVQQPASTERRAGVASDQLQVDATKQTVSGPTTLGLQSMKGTLT